MQKYAYVEQNDLFKDILEKYIRERVKNEVRNERLENKIARLRSGSKRQHQKYEKEVKEVADENKHLKNENESLKLGIIHRDEILKYVFEEVEDKKIKDYLSKVFLEI